MKYSYQYARPALTVDVVVCVFEDDCVKVLLVERGGDPFRGSWALPGGFVDIDEEIPVAAARELAEETGIEGVDLTELGAFGRVDRDPRGRTVSVVYMALARAGTLRVAAGSDAAAARWFSIARLPEVAFDHGEVLAAARAWLAAQVFCSAAAFDLLPAHFTLGQMLRLFEQVTGGVFESRIFRRRARATGLLVPVGRQGREVIYRFDRRLCRRLSGPTFFLSLAGR